MLIQPEYCENIIVGVTYMRKFHWYVTNKTIWILDYQKKYDSLEKYYAQIGHSKKQFIYEVGDFNSFCKDRWGISVLNNDSAKVFFSKIEQNEADTDELKKAFDCADDKSDYFPVLYIDFDKRELFSYFPEPENFQDFVPDGWNGVYKNFDNLIPIDKKYWA